MDYRDFKLSEVIISLGSNHGNRIGNVAKAIEWLHCFSDNFKCSSIYETPEIHGKGDPYMNAVVRLYTSNPLDTMQLLTKAFERDNGRDEKCRSKGMVPIDIDIVVWNSIILRPLDYSREFFKIGYSQI